MGGGKGYHLRSLEGTFTDTGDMNVGPLVLDSMLRDERLTHNGRFSRGKRYWNSRALPKIPFHLDPRR